MGDVQSSLTKFLVYQANSYVAYWHTVSFCCRAEFDRYRSHSGHRARCTVASVQSPLGRRVAVPVEGLVACGDHHALGIEMVVKAFGAELAPDAGVIDPAPRRGRIEAVMIVDPDDAGLDAGGDAMRAGDVAGPDRSGKPERRIIGEPQRVGFVLERRDRSEWSEHFFLEDAHVGLDVREHGRCDEVTVLVAGHVCR